MAKLPDRAHPENPPEATGPVALKTSDDDPDYKIAHISEGFRISKRNLLFWSMLTILLALGDPGTDNGKFVIGGVLPQTEFDHWMLLAFALAVLAFMAVGFWRSERRMTLRNIDLTYDKPFVQIAERIGELEDIIEENIKIEQAYRQRLKEYDRISRQTTEWIRGRAMKATKELNHIVGHARSTLQDTLKKIIKQSKNVRILENEETKLVVPDQREQIRTLLDQVDHDLCNSLAKLENIDNELLHIEDELTKDEQEINSASRSESATAYQDAKNADLNTLKDIKSQFDGLSNAIALPERLLTKWHDRIVPYSAASVAGLYACYRIAELEGGFAFIANWSP